MRRDGKKEKILYITAAVLFVVLAAALIVWKLTVGRRRYRYGRSVPRRRGGGYRGRRRH